jgi:hypothetical protein
LKALEPLSGRIFGIIGPGPFFAAFTLAPLNATAPAVNYPFLSQEANDRDGGPHARAPSELYED